MLDFLHHFISSYETLWYWEPIGTLLGLIYVVLAAKANKWCFVFGFISSFIFVFVFFNTKLYFDAGINVYYLIMSFWGWFAWSDSSSKKNELIQVTPRKTLLYGIIISFFVSFVAAALVDRFSDPQLPYLDALTTAFSIFATWLVIKKYIENWLIWIVVDIVASGMYIYKELYFVAGLFAVMTLIAIIGYFKWKKLLQNS